MCAYYYIHIYIYIHACLHLISFTSTCTHCTELCVHVQKMNLLKHFIWDQEFADLVKTHLERPGCMDGSSFVAPDTQCPQKPRGRKKSKPADPATKTPASERPEKSKGKPATAKNAIASSRPSAAACGFSTHHMTDEQVAERLEKERLPPTEHTEPEPAPTKGRTTKKRPAHVEVEADNCIPCKVPKVSQTGKKRGKKNKKDTTEVEHAEEKPARSKRSRKSKPSKNEAPSASSTTHDTADAAVPANVADPGLTEPDPRAEARAAAKAAQKAKFSRKSSAYHKAALAAKKRGATPDEIKAAGKAVSCFIYVCSLPSGSFCHVQHLHILRSDYPCSTASS